VDSSGSACITGDGIVPPTASLPANQAGDPGGIFITKLTPSGTGLVFSTQIGGPYMGTGTSVAVDSSGNTYFAGITASSGFPAVGAVQSTPGGDFDAFLVKLVLTNGGTAVPAITQISPAAADIYSSVTLQVTGQNFTSGSVVQWNGVAKSTTFVSATQLTALLTSADLVTPGASWVNVSTPGAGWSNYLKFAVNGNVPPVLEQLSVSQFTVGQQALTLQVTGSGLASSSVVQWNGNNLPTTFVSSRQLNAPIPAANLAAPGTANVTIYTPPPGGGTSAAETVMILPPPMISTGGIVNSASYTSQVTAGELVSLFGANFVDTASLSVNGVAVPILYVGLEQINFQMPWQLQGQSMISLVVSANGVNSSPQTIALLPYAPAIFSLNQQGTGQGAILIAGANGAVAGIAPGIGGRAVMAGETVEIYMTGLGPVLNPPASGATATNTSTTTSMPTVTIGGASASVSFSGLAPTFIGLYQVNAVVPSRITTGAATPVIVTIGGVQSNMVTIATQ